MSHRVVSDHVESLCGGQMVGPGDQVTDAEAKRNPRLVERGVLAPEFKPEPTVPAPQEKKEEF